MPDFILFDSQTRVIEFVKPTENEIGNYEVKLSALLHDPDQTYSEARISIQVIDPCIDSIVNSDG